MNNFTSTFLLAVSLSACFAASADEFVSVLTPEHDVISRTDLIGPANKGDVEILFATDSAKLSPAAIAALKPFIGRTKFDPSAIVTLSGYSDVTGSKNHNMVLSLNRAKRVRDYLIDQGVRPENLRVVGHGENRAAINILEPKRLVADRRVVITSSNGHRSPPQEHVTSPIVYAHAGTAK